MIGDVRKIGVRRCLRAEKLDLFESIRRQRRQHGRRSDAMQRRIDDPQIARAGDRLLMHGPEKGGIDLGLAIDDPAGRERFGERLAVNLARVHHPVDDARVVRRQHLSAGRPIDLHGVVGGGIVAGGDHDAAIAMVIPHGERKLGRAAEAVQVKDLEPGRDHDLAAKLGEMPRLMPRVISNRTRKLPLLFSLWPLASRLLPNIIRCHHPLSTLLTNRPIVDGVGPDRIHPPPPPAGAEGDDGPKDVVQLLPKPRANLPGDFGGIFRIPRLGELEAADRGGRQQGS